MDMKPDDPIEGMLIAQLMTSRVGDVREGLVIFQWAGEIVAAIPSEVSARMRKTDLFIH
jgi:hypothetical protein